jgi:surface protein
MKAKNFILLIFSLALLNITFVNAVDFTEAHGINLESNVPLIGEVGFQVVIGGVNIDISEITKSSGTQVDYAKIYDSSFSTIANSPFSGDVASFSGVTLLAGQTYYFVVYDSINGMFSGDINFNNYFPISGTYLTWTQGGGYDYGWSNLDIEPGIVSITISNPPPPVVTCSQCNNTCSPCGGGCTATDLSNMYSAVSNFDATFGDITGWNTTCITNMQGMFASSDFNQDISNWNTSSVTNMYGMFQYAEQFNQNLSKWDISNVANIDYFLYGVKTLSTPYYDSMLKSWANQPVQNNLNFNGGKSQYSNDALSARNTTLIGTHNWNITDGGTYTTPVINLTKGLIRMWNFENTLADGKDNYTPIITGAISYQEGINGSSAYFDGSTCAIFPKDQIFNLSKGDFSFSVWVNQTSTSGAPRIFGIRGQGTTYHSATYAGTPWGGLNSNLIIESSDHVSKPITYNTGDLVHWIVVRDKEIVTFYRDGTIYTTEAIYPYGNPITEVNEFSIGCLNLSNVMQQFYYGTMDAFYFYNRSLNQAEVNALQTTFLPDTFGQITPECTNDNECGTCMKCVANNCVNETNLEDFKNECNNGTGCLNPYTLQNQNGLCNGQGQCNGNTTTNVSIGNVCINGNDTNPTISVNCGTWANCTTNSTTAPQYYVGYAGNATTTCVQNDWIISGTNLQASSGFQFLNNEIGSTCAQILIPTLPTTKDELTDSIVDTFIKIITGIGAIAVIIGLMAVLSLSLYAFRKIKP